MHGCCSGSSQCSSRRLLPPRPPPHSLPLGSAATDSTASVEPSADSAASASANDRAGAFPTAVFTGISLDPVANEVAAEFQTILNNVAAHGGMAATVMSAGGTWSGAAGTADGVRNMRVDDQFAIGSVTKSIVAAQVMQLVQEGELSLDDPVAEHLPPGLDFDTNGTTIRQLLGMHSGIPDYVPVLWDSLSTDRQHVWTPADLLELVPADRAPAGDEFDYSSTNYLLLGLVIEQVRGRPVAAVLRDGVLGIDGVERLAYQPDEIPTAPMAMPDGESADALEKGGGYLPSLAGASAAVAAGGIASDAVSLARWWQAFSAGDVVSPASLTAMSTFDDGYGLGLFNPVYPYPRAVGHEGEHVGYVSSAACIPEVGAVVVVLSNRIVER